jgi:hypothetical protein
VGLTGASKKQGDKGRSGFNPLDCLKAIFVMLGLCMADLGFFTGEDGYY